MEDFSQIWNVKYMGFVDYCCIFWCKTKASMSGVKRIRSIEV